MNDITIDKSAFIGVIFLDEKKNPNGVAQLYTQQNDTGEKFIGAIAEH